VIEATVGEIGAGLDDAEGIPGDVAVQAVGDVAPPGRHPPSREAKSAANVERLIDRAELVPAGPGAEGEVLRELLVSSGLDPPEVGILGLAVLVVDVVPEGREEAGPLRGLRAQQQRHALGRDIVVPEHEVLALLHARRLPDEGDRDLADFQHRLPVRKRQPARRRPHLGIHQVQADVVGVEVDPPAEGLVVAAVVLVARDQPEHHVRILVDVHDTLEAEAVADPVAVTALGTRLVLLVPPALVAEAEVA
jgi:hypothetical protein